MNGGEDRAREEAPILPWVDGLKWVGCPARPPQSEEPAQCESLDSRVSAPFFAWQPIGFIRLFPGFFPGFWAGALREAVTACRLASFGEHN